jgi:hypothetical protein
MSWWSDLVQKDTQREPDPVLPKTGQMIDLFNSTTNENNGMYLVVDDNHTKTEIRFYGIKGKYEGQNMKATKKWFLTNPNHWKVISEESGGEP